LAAKNLGQKTKEQTKKHMNEHCYAFNLLAAKKSKDMKKKDIFLTHEKQRRVKNKATGGDHHIGSNNESNTQRCSGLFGLAPVGARTIAFNPTFGSFTLLQPASH
jgi:hypothetical protein